jgi:hypothetical protein
MPILSLFEVPFLLATQSPIVCFYLRLCPKLGDYPKKSRLESLCFSVFNPQRNQCFTSDEKHNRNRPVARRLSTPRQKHGSADRGASAKNTLPTRPPPALRLIPHKFATSGR